MKKLVIKKQLLIGIIGVVLVLLILFGLWSIISVDKVVCESSSKQKKSGYNIDSKYVIKSKGNIVDKVEITETVTSKDKNTLKTFEDSFNNLYSSNKESYGGYKYKVTNKNGTVKSNLTIDYNKFDMIKFIKDNPAMKKYTKNNKLTTDGAKAYYESTGAKCK